MGIFLDGDLAYESHSISPQQLLNLLEIPFDADFADCDWLEENSTFPDRIEDVTFEADED